MVGRMTSFLSSLAAFVGRRPRRSTLAILVLLAVLLGGAIGAGGAFEDDFTVPGIESQRAQDLLEQRFPSASGTQATLVFSSGDGAVTGRGETREIRAALATIAGQPHVTAVEDPFEAAGRISPDRRTAFASVGYDRTAEKLDELRPCQRRIVDIHTPHVLAAFRLQRGLQ